MENFYPVSLDNLQRIEYNGQPVLTTAQLAEKFETTVKSISANFKNNEVRFVEGKHFFKLENVELDNLRSNDIGLQISPMTRVLYLWTKRGATRHSKLIGTDVAWEMFELLENTYFNVEKYLSEKPLVSITDFERGKETAKLVPHTKDPFAKARLVAKSANLLLGEHFLDIPASRPNVQLTLFS